MRLRQSTLGGMVACSDVLHVQMLAASSTKYSQRVTALIDDDPDRRGAEAYVLLGSDIHRSARSILFLTDGLEFRKWIDRSQPAQDRRSRHRILVLTITNS